MLANEYFPRGELAVGAGWHQTAAALLEEEAEGPAHGLHAWTHAQLALIQRDIAAALEHSTSMAEIGQRVGDRDIALLGRATQARALVQLGRVEEAMAAIDEAMAAAVSGSLRPRTACHIYCQTLTVCGELGDYRRAGEWTVAAQRCCVRESIVPASGDCRIHRAGVLRWRGAWTEAEADARRGCDEIGGNVIHLGLAHYEIGEIRLRRGDLEAAEEAFKRAHELGRPPYPGLALLRLAEGRIDAATALIEEALGAEPVELLRAALLPSRVEIALAAGDREAAHAAADELVAIAGRFDTPALQAAAACSRGANQLADRDPQAAASLRRGAQLWQEIGVPYEAAVARRMLGQAHLVREDTESAVLELSAARRVFERLGAARDVRGTTEQLEALGVEDRSTEQRASRTFMFTDIARSTQLVEAIGDEAWSHVVRWHDETLRALFVKFEGEEVDHTGDGFFVAFDDTTRALGCAAEIQRTLAEHRQRHGFSPQLRIGLHACESTRTREGYRGRGIHVAARIGARAGADEIVVSRASLGDAERSLMTGNPETVELKGVAEPVEIVAVHWR
ncbi:MAG: LuxR family transcriptional regulator [Thermoleophilia bacterium]|nr:LuxR family transcriptional regulator [Thermoleophilia bacterium]